MANKFNKPYLALSRQDLIKKRGDLTNEYRRLVISKRMQQLEQPHLLRATRREMARVETRLNEIAGSAKGAPQKKESEEKVNAKSKSK